MQLSDTATMAGVASCAAQLTCTVSLSRMSPAHTHTHTGWWLKAFPDNVCIQYWWQINSSSSHRHVSHSNSKVINLLWHGLHNYYHRSNQADEPMPHTIPLSIYQTEFQLEVTSANYSCPLIPAFLVYHQCISGDICGENDQYNNKISLLCITSKLAKALSQVTDDSSICYNL